MPRPLGAGVLTIIGGFFIILGGLLFALIGVFFAVFGFVSGIFLLGLLVGFLTLVMGLLMIAVPSGHTVWGILAIVLAIASLPVAFGGFILGFLLNPDWGHSGLEVEATGRRRPHCRRTRSPSPFRVASRWAEEWRAVPARPSPRVDRSSCANDRAGFSAVRRRAGPSG